MLARAARVPARTAIGVAAGGVDTGGAAQGLSTRAARGARVVAANLIRLARRGAVPAVGRIGRNAGATTLEQAWLTLALARLTRATIRARNPATAAVLRIRRGIHALGAAGSLPRTVIPSATGRTAGPGRCPRARARAGDQHQDKAKRQPSNGISHAPGLLGPAANCHEKSSVRSSLARSPLALPPAWSAVRLEASEREAQRRNAAHLVLGRQRVTTFVGGP